MRPRPSDRTSSLGLDSSRLHENNQLWICPGSNQIIGYNRCNSGRAHATAGGCTKKLGEYLSVTDAVILFDAHATHTCQDIAYDATRTCGPRNL